MLFFLYFLLSFFLLFLFLSPIKFPFLLNVTAFTQSPTRNPSITKPLKPSFIFPIIGITSISRYLLLQFIHNNLLPVIELILMEPLTSYPLWFGGIENIRAQLVQFLHGQLLDCFLLLVLLLPGLLVIKLDYTEVLEFELIILAFILRFQTLSPFLTHIIKLLLILLHKGLLLPKNFSPCLDLLLDHILELNYLIQQLFRNCWTVNLFERKRLLVDQP